MFYEEHDIIFALNKILSISRLHNNKKRVIFNLCTILTVSANVIQLKSSTNNCRVSVIVLRNTDVVNLRLLSTVVRS